MLFAAGTKVRLVHTGDTGKITALLPDGMVMVELTNGFEIPVFPEDLARTDDVVIQTKSPPVPPKIEPQQPAPAKISPHETGFSEAIQLAFEPKNGVAGAVEKFQTYLINGTNYDVLYDFELSFSVARPLKGDGILKSKSAFFIGEMLFDLLNEAPEFDIEIRPITTEGEGNPIHKTLKIKPKHFFSKTEIQPLTGKEAHSFLLFDKFGNEKTESSEDLKTYTQRVARPSKFRPNLDSWLVEHRNVKEFADFLPEVDLHLEKLTEKPQKLNNAEAVRLQIRVFEEFMTKAIRLGVPRVFVIHGIGKGRLRDEIATRLMRMPEVKTFKNEFHPRYGWGATEVEL